MDQIDCYESAQGAGQKRQRSSTICLAAAAATAIIGGYTILCGGNHAGGVAVVHSSLVSQTSIIFGSNKQPRNSSDDAANNDPCQIGTWSPSGVAKRNRHGFYGDLGVIYSVAGPSSYAQTEFLPLIQYLRDGLGIPDAAERKSMRSSVRVHGSDVVKRQNPALDSHNRTEKVDRAIFTTKWSLVTEPHLCNGILRPILPFFDVITVLDLDTSLDEIKKGQRHHRSRYLEERESGAGTTNINNAVKTNEGPRKDQHQHDVALHRAKAVKVLAMTRYAPFAHTIFIDLDMQPCKPTFAKLLMKSFASRRPNSDSVAPFDVALPYASHSGANLPMPPLDKTIHYRGNQQKVGKDRGKGKEDEKEKKGGRGTNQHNTACVVLNITSDATKELLRRFEHAFFSLSMPTLDQPSFGRALFSMWKEGTADKPPIRSRTIHHIDLDVDLICRKRSRDDRRKDRGIANLKCGKSNDCLLIHKPAA